MTKTLQKPNFRTQLRGMLQLHTETIASPPVPVSAVAADLTREKMNLAKKPDVWMQTAALDPSPVSIANVTKERPEQNQQPVVPIPAPVADINLPRSKTPQTNHPVISAQPDAPLEPQTLTRFSVRIEHSELDSLNQIIVRGIQELGERITVSDVFRVGLSRVGKGSPISAAEIAVIRTTDGRRHKLNRAWETGAAP